MQCPYIRVLKTLDEELKEEVKVVYDELSGADTPDLRTFEVRIIVAFKD